MNTQAFRCPGLLALVAGTLMLAGCHRSEGGSTAGAPPTPQPGIESVTSIPLGDVAGAAQSTAAAQIHNPYSNDPQAVAQGQALFIKMNCAGCHGYGAKGGMGPNLTDSYWRYGGVPASIFNSIYQGRPQGMPAWNPALPAQDIWKIVAYLQSLGGSYAPDQYQAWLQGDRPGSNVAAEVTRTAPAQKSDKDSGGSKGDSTAAAAGGPKVDLSPPADTKK